ncbi:MAG: SET domain-containing protein [Alphaproteobacteria bacterium]|nr:MAG: SET domain-containing protein [Alphaproteobacteria bacterium]
MLLVPTRLAPSPIHGLGVFAAAPIARGTPVWRFASGLDMAFAPNIVEGLPEHVRTFFAHYGYLDRNVGRIVLCFDDARFVNHSDRPNVATDYAQDRYGLDVALRDIAAGEELTMDYAGFEESAGRGF